MLHEHVERCDQRASRLDAPRVGGVTRRCRLDELERLRRHDGDLRHGTGPMAAAARALQQARDALRAADLQHLVDRCVVDAEIEARRAHDGAKLARAQAVLDEIAHVALERAVMKRDLAGPVGARVEQRLVPDFGGRPHVGEDQRRARTLDGADDLRQQREPDVAAPGEALDRRRTRGCNRDFLGHDALDDARLGNVTGADKTRERFVEVGERCREAPYRQTLRVRAQARQR